jgi:hypothetical protein
MVSLKYNHNKIKILRQTKRLKIICDIKTDICLMSTIVLLSTPKYIKEEIILLIKTDRIKTYNIFFNSSLLREGDMVEKIIGKNSIGSFIFKS